MTEIAYTIEVQPGTLQDRSSSSALDDEPLFRERLEDVKQRISDGDPWAHCCARVIATCGLFKAMSYWLGYFTYDSEEDFMLSSDYEYMRAEAREELLKELKKSSEMYALLSTKEVISNLRQASELYQVLLIQEEAISDE